MQICENLSERRKQTRYMARNNTFIGFGSNSMKIGKILDISRGGIAFQNTQPRTKFFEFAELSLIVDDESLNIQQVPFKFPSKMVSVSDMPSKNPFNFIKVRRYAVEFQNLSELQLFWLDYFIKKHTICEI